MVRLNPLAKSGRKMRRPSYQFHVRQQPWVIQPFMAAPVLPGETLKNLLLQARVVTDPIKNPLIGWWQEYYFFYVKHRDLSARATLEALMLDDDANLTSLNSAAKVQTYHGGGAPDWMSLCLECVVEEFFRADDEAWNNVLIDTLPIAAINQDNWLDSVINATGYIGDIDVEVEGADANTTIQASEIDKAMRVWQYARGLGLTDMSYEDYLRTFGVKIPDAEKPNRPELIRYIREWTYPTNTVEPTTGVPSSACSWSIQERADKDRFFKEPGFILGVTITRPKVYLSKQTASANMLLNDAFSWLPAIMRDDPYTSLKQVAAASGPLSGNTDAYIVDVKDLFLYGEQFVNFALTATDAGMVALPTAGLQKRYVAQADIDGLFVTPASKKLVRQDGIATLAIAGSLVDTTPVIEQNPLV